MSRPACSLRRLSSRRLATWLSLFAVLLIYLGPLVAQTRVLQIMPAEPTAQVEHGAAYASAYTHEPLSAQGSGHSEHVSEHLPELSPQHPSEHGAAHASAHTPEPLSAQGSGHSEHVSEHPPELSPQHPAEHSAHHGADSLGDACGYCSLLLNSPALGNNAFMLGAAPLLDHTPRRVQPHAAPRLRSAFPDARPRAPPAFS